MVRNELEKLGIHYKNIELGMVETEEDINDEILLELKSNLAISGLELMDNKRSILVDRVKNVIIEMIHYSDEIPTVNYSDYIAKKLDYDYTYLSNLFSEVKGITIQHFIIKHKIERAKELILYNELNLTEIAYKLNYKKVTGHTPSYYRKIGQKRKCNLENL